MIKGFFMVILSAILFGLMPFTAKYIYLMGGNPLTLCFHRFFFSIPFLYLLARFVMKQKMGVTREELKKITVLSFGCAGTPILLFSSYHYISSGMATTVHFVYPILVLLGCALVFHETISRRKQICCLLCLIGIISFYTPGEAGGLTGLLLAFVSGITYAFYILYYSRSNLTQMDPYKLSFYLSVISSVEVFAAGMAMKSLVFTMPAKAWGISVGFAFMVSVLATVAFQIGTRTIGPQMASMLSTFEPLTSVLVGVLLFGEPLTLRSGAGIICILCAVSLLSAKTGRSG